MKKYLFPIILVGFVGCSSGHLTKKEIEKTLEENPDIVWKLIEKHPEKFIESFQRAAIKSKETFQARKREEERLTMEAYFDRPLEPTIRKDETFRGDRNAALTLVEYLDFECPFCSRGNETVESLRERYGKNLKIVYKHLPLSFHPSAMISAKYYEAIRLQSEKKAFLFHDQVFKNQPRLRKGENYLKEVARDLKVDMKRLALDLKSKKIEERIQEDMDEAGKLGFNGTPGYLINGIPVKGALPEENFVQIINELVKRKKVNL